MDSKTFQITGKHKAGKASQLWPGDWIDTLPENFRNYRAVFWDIKNQTLIVVPQGTFNGDGPVPKISMCPNVSTKVETAFSVVGLGSAPADDLMKSPQYKLLGGKL